MSADVESILRLLRMLPPSAIEEVADFTNYLFRKYVQAPVDERVARRTANRWLVERVGNMVMADQPLLTQSEGRLIWRFGAFVTSLSHAPCGPIGHVDVDATTGEIQADDRTVEKLRRRGTTLQ